MVLLQVGGSCGGQDLLDREVRPGGEVLVLAQQVVVSAGLILDDVERRALVVEGTAEDVRRVHVLAAGDDRCDLELLQVFQHVPGLFFREALREQHVAGLAVQYFGAVVAEEQPEVLVHVELSGPFDEAHVRAPARQGEQHSVVLRSQQRLFGPWRDLLAVIGQGPVDIENNGFDHDRLPFCSCF